MFVIRILDDDKKLSDKIYRLCESLTGWEPFVESEVLISDPIYGPNNTKFSEILIGPAKDSYGDKSIVISVKSSEIKLC